MRLFYILKSFQYWGARGPGFRGPGFRGPGAGGKPWLKHLKNLKKILKIFIYIKNILSGLPPPPPNKKLNLDLSIRQIHVKVGVGASFPELLCIIDLERWSKP